MDLFKEYQYIPFIKSYRHLDNIISIKDKLLEHWSKLPPIFIRSSSKKIGRKEILASIKKTLESL